MKWFRIDKSNGTFEAVHLASVVRMATSAYSNGREAMATGEFQTPFAYYYREDHLRISCGCCRGPETDRCICWVKQWNTS